VAAPQGLDGVSILPALLDQPQPVAREYLYWEFTGRSTAQAVRLEEWKGIRTAPGAPVQLYRLTDDMQEERDRAAERPEIVRRIETIMKSARTDSPDFPMRH
jgi:arylsulfatase A